MKRLFVVNGFFCIFFRRQPGRSGACTCRYYLMSTTLNVLFDHLFFDKTASMVSKYPHLSGTAKTSITTGTPKKLQIEGYEGGHVLVDNFADDDYMVQFTANLNSGKKVVALVRYEDQNNHYFIEIGSGASNNVRLYEMVSGKPTSIGSPGTATTTGDVNVKIKLAGNIIKVWVGGTLEINESPSTFASGGVGFTSDIAQFWDIKVGYDDNGDDDIDDAGDDVFYDDDFTTTSVTVTYDDNGNLTDDGTFKYVYDAWNRLVQVKSSNDDSIIIATYTYDALGRRIKKVVENRGELDGTTLYYYNHRWQLLETRDGSQGLDMQIIHGTQYIDEIVRFGKVGRGEMFVFQDANWNVTSAVGFSGIVLDRITTTPYGQPTFDTQTVNGDYDGDGDLDTSDDTQLTTCINAGTPPSACRMYDYDLDGDVDSSDGTLFHELYPVSGPDVITRRIGQGNSFNGLVFAHQGLVRDAESQSYHNRRRRYFDRIRRFAQRDPLAMHAFMKPVRNSLLLLHQYNYLEQNTLSHNDPIGLVPCQTSPSHCAHDCMCRAEAILDRCLSNTVHDRRGALEDCDRYLASCLGAAAILTVECVSLCLPTAPLPPVFAGCVADCVLLGAGGVVVGCIVPYRECVQSAASDFVGDRDRCYTTFNQVTSLCTQCTPACQSGG